MSGTASTDGLPAVVLVHGAFADGSSWNGVIERLQARGVAVIAPANPLRGLAADSAYLAGVLQETHGPVVAVGHSYGGAVITNASVGAKNVVGLVFVAAFAPDEGERLGDVTATSKDAVLATALVPHNTLAADGTEPTVEFSVDPARFHDVFASDLTAAEAAVMAATQRPVAEPAFSEPTRAAAWKEIPSWAVVATADRAAGTDVVRAMAKRASATITEVDGSHVIMVSQPQVVTEVIMEAVAEPAQSGRAWANELVESYLAE
jgi:pimeloyl-ACP methyl ester carboxylesterase